MTQKIDLRRKHDGEYPPDIAKLIELCEGRVRDAERRAGVSAGDFNKIRIGKKNHTNLAKTRVGYAIQNFNPQEITLPPTSAAKVLTIPEKCPPVLAELIRKTGSKKPVIELLGTSDGSFYSVLAGTQQMPPGWLVKIKEALGQSLIPANEPREEPPPPQVPQFVPWDGKTGSVTVGAAPGKKPRTIKNVPLPVVQLVEKHGGSVTKAARAMGMTMGGLMPLVEGKAEFNDKRQRKVHDALHGAAPAFSAENEMPDKCTLGQAIVVTKAAGYDFIQQIADIMSARLVFKMNTSAGWLLIYKMPGEDLLKFKRLAMRDAQRVVCP